MYNLLISLGIALACFALGALVTQSAVAGILPALFGLVLAYFFLARRTYKQVEVVAQTAMGELANAQQDPSAIDRASALISKALPLGQWQFLVGAQLQGQLGQLAFMKANMKQSKDFSAAKAHLLKSWTRDWLSQTILSVVLYEEKQNTEALERLEKAKSGGSDQAMYWAVYAWIAKSSGQSDVALKVLSEGLEKKKGHEGLTAFRDAAANDQALPIQAFSPQWCQFFPMHIQKLSYQEQMQLMGENAPPMSRAQRRAMKRGADPQNQPKKGKYNIPHPRR